MERRTFLKTTSGASILGLIAPRSIADALKTTASAALEESFKNPPSIAKPFTWWHWMNGNISKEGITLDLEAMKEVGIGGVQCFNVGSRIPKGSADYLSKQWLDLTKHAINECARLGIEFDMHNCPGWSSTGGPWITPELSMQQVVWTETLVTGGRLISESLPRPFVKLNHYRDTFVMAFPALKGETQSFEELRPLITTHRGTINHSEFGCPDFTAGIDVHLLSQEKPGFLQFEYPFEIEARSLTLFCAPIPEGISSSGVLQLEASSDGVTYQKIIEVKRAGRNLEMPATASFPSVKARVFRLVIPYSLHVADVRLSGAARLLNWPSKANFPGAGSAGTQLNANVALQQSINIDVPEGSVIDPSSVIDLTSSMDKEGRLHWQAPSGRWLIIRMGHTAVGRENNAAPESGGGLECDKYSRVAYDFHFKKVFGDLLPYLKEIGKKTRIGLLVDSYEVGMQNWTPDLPKEFEQRRGYNFLCYLPAFTGRIVGSEQETERFLWDLRKTHADLMADNYHGYVAELCKEHGILAYTEPYNNGPFQQMEVGSRMNINMGEFWIRNPHFFPSVKLASSIAHVYGQRVGDRQIVGAESFTGEAVHSKWQEHPYAMKAQGDLMFTRGLNRFIFHRYAHQPHPTALPGMTMGPWGIHFDRTNTWFSKGKEWLRYISRCQSLLQQGNAVIDLLYFTGEDVPGDDLSLKYEPDPAPPKGYDYNFIDSKALIDRTDIKKGRIVLPDGTSYTALVLPEKETMTLEVARRLRRLVSKGLVLVGSAPIRTPGLFNSATRDAELSNLVRELWGDPVAEKIDRKVGRGRVIKGADLKQVLESLNIGPDIWYSSESGKAIINYVHRKVDGTDIYFIANRMRTQENVVLDFRIAHKQPELWHPDTGDIVPVKLFESIGDRTRTNFSFDPCGSYFVVFRSSSSVTPVKSIEKEGIRLLGTEGFPTRSIGQYASVFNNFSISVWVKPEVEERFSGPYLYDRGIASNVFYPPQGELLYGKGHVTCGLVAARNGLAVYERSTGYPSHFQSVQLPLSGWTHIVLVYQAGAPSIYVNGEFVKSGTASGKVVHPGLGEESQDEFSWFFEGDKTEPELHTQKLSSEEIREIYRKGRPQFESLQSVQQDKGGFLFWQNGQYSLSTTKNQGNTFSVEGTGVVARLSSDWQVTFPGGLGAPSKVSLPELLSLHLHPDSGIKHFSGTATYSKTFTLRPEILQTGNRLFLDLGQVAVIAGLKVNGAQAGLLWKPPFRTDITTLLKPGENHLEIEVTNLWPNRLIGDEHLPEENEYINPGARGSGIKALPEWYITGKPKPEGGRVTFSTWKHFDKNSPLLESGLVGPVVLRAAVFKA